jgi:tetraacyldisaccharide-1-P 4'-kinase
LGKTPVAGFLRKRFDRHVVKPVVEIQRGHRGRNPDNRRDLLGRRPAIRTSKIGV